MLSYRREAVSIAKGGIVEKPFGWNQAGKTLLGVEDPQQVWGERVWTEFKMHLNAARDMTAYFFVIHFSFIHTYPSTQFPTMCRSGGTSEPTATTSWL